MMWFRILIQSPIMNRNQIINNQCKLPQTSEAESNPTLHWMGRVVSLSTPITQSLTRIQLNPLRTTKTWIIKRDICKIWCGNTTSKPTWMLGSKIKIHQTTRFHLKCKFFLNNSTVDRMISNLQTKDQTWKSRKFRKIIAL